MNLHEYQGKQLFAEYGLPVSQGIACNTADEAVAAAEKIGGDSWVVKAQVHAGGRGKAGGVKLVKNTDDIRAFAEQWLGKKLVTFQTDEHGQPVSKILVESLTDIDLRDCIWARLSTVVPAVLCSWPPPKVALKFETVAEETPEKILKAEIDPLVGAQPYQGRELAFKLGLEGKQIGQFTKIFIGLAKLFEDYDLALLEINPLVITPAGDLHCLDAKIGVDGNALYRQKKLQAMRDPSQEDSREAEAAAWELNYVALDGNIGCMVNGAGLAMATMDLIKFAGGEPANFLDVGGTADAKRVEEAFRIILSDEKVEAILINIFGGIVRCDRVANGVVEAYKNLGDQIKVPIIVRLQGTNAEEAKRIIDNSGLNVESAVIFQEAADKVQKVLA